MVRCCSKPSSCVAVMMCLPLANRNVGFIRSPAFAGCDGTTVVPRCAGDDPSAVRRCGLCAREDSPFAHCPPRNVASTNSRPSDERVCFVRRPCSQIVMRSPFSNEATSLLRRRPHLSTIMRQTDLLISGITQGRFVFAVRRDWRNRRSAATDAFPARCLASILGTGAASSLRLAVCSLSDFGRIFDRRIRGMCTAPRTSRRPHSARETVSSILQRLDQML